MAKRKRSALVELRRLEAAFQKNRMEVLNRAKDEAAAAVGSIVKQLQTFAADFPDIVANAVHHLASGVTKPPGAKRGRPAKLTHVGLAKPKVAKPTKATPAQLKAIIGALIMNKDAIANHALAKHAKLSPAVVSVALRQLRDEGKVKSEGKGRATTWTMAGK